MSHSVPPPSQAEITRKLSVHAVVKSPPKVRAAWAVAAQSRALTTPHGPNQKAAIAPGPVSGTESDSDSVPLPEAAAAGPSPAVLLVGSPSQPPPLSSIAEQPPHSEGESEDDEDDEDGGWRVEDVSRAARGSLDETVLKTGYLWKKGERRKVRCVPRRHDLHALTPAAARARV